MSTPGQWAGGLAAWGDAEQQRRLPSVGDRGHGRSYVQRAVRRPRSSRRRVVAVRQAHHHRRLPDGPQHRGGGPPTRVTGRTRHARRRSGTRDQQPGGGIAARRRDASPQTCDTCCRRSSASPSTRSPPTSTWRWTGFAASSPIEPQPTRGRSRRWTARSSSAPGWRTAAWTNRGRWRRCSPPPARTKPGSKRASLSLDPRRSVQRCIGSRRPSVHRSCCRS